MTSTEARAIADEEQEQARQMSGSGHGATEHRARLARIILDLCSQLDAYTTPPTPPGDAWIPIDATGGQVLVQDHAEAPPPPPKPPAKPKAKR